MTLPPSIADRIEVYPDVAAWLEARAATAVVPYRIGASDVGAILGVSSWASPWDIWRSKRLGIYPERTEAEEAVLQRGHRFEPLVLAEYEAKTGRQVLLGPQHAIARHPTIEWATCSPDGLTFDGDELGGVEAKTTTQADSVSRDVTEMLSADAEAALPKSWLAQVYWQLEVLDVPWVDFAVLLPWYDCHIVRVHRDEDMQARLVERVTAWRQRHLVEGNEPPTDDSGACRAHQLDRPRGRESIRATDYQAELAANIVGFKHARDVAERERRRAEAELLRTMADDDAHTLTVGRGRRIRRTSNGLRITWR